MTDQTNSQPGSQTLRKLSLALHSIVPRRWHEPFEHPEPSTTPSLEEVRRLIAAARPLLPSSCVDGLKRRIEIWNNASPEQQITIAELVANKACYVAHNRVSWNFYYTDSLPEIVRSEAIALEIHSPAGIDDNNDSLHDRCVHMTQIGDIVVLEDAQPRQGDDWGDWIVRSILDNNTRSAGVQLEHAWQLAHFFKASDRFLSLITPFEQQQLCAQLHARLIATRDALTEREDYNLLTFAEYGSARASEALQPDDKRGCADISLTDIIRTRRNQAHAHRSQDFTIDFAITLAKIAREDDIIAILLLLPYGFTMLEITATLQRFRPSSLAYLMRDPRTRKIGANAIATISMEHKSRSLKTDQDVTDQCIIQQLMRKALLDTSDYDTFFDLLGIDLLGLRNSHTAPASHNERDGYVDSLERELRNNENSVLKALLSWLDTQIHRSACSLAVGIAACSRLLRLNEQPEQPSTLRQRLAATVVKQYLLLPGYERQCLVSICDIFVDCCLFVKRYKFVWDEFLKLPTDTEPVSDVLSDNVSRLEMMVALAEFSTESLLEDVSDAALRLRKQNSDVQHEWTLESDIFRSRPKMSLLSRLVRRWSTLENRGERFIKQFIYGGDPDPIEIMRVAIALRPGTPIFDEVREHLETVSETLLRERSAHADLLMEFARTFLIVLRPEQALRFIKCAEEIAEETSIVKRTTALKLEALNALKRYGETLSSYNSIFEIDASTITDISKCQAAIASAFLNKVPEACALLQGAINNGSSNECVFATLARIQIEQGNPERALSVVSRFRKMKEKDFSWHRCEMAVIEAEAYWKLDKIHEAAELVSLLEGDIAVSYEAIRLRLNFFLTSPDAKNLLRDAKYLKAYDPATADALITKLSISSRIGLGADRIRMHALVEKQDFARIVDIKHGKKAGDFLQELFIGALATVADRPARFQQNDTKWGRGVKVEDWITDRIDDIVRLSIIDCNGHTKVRGGQGYGEKTEGSPDLVVYSNSQRTVAVVEAKIWGPGTKKIEIFGGLKQLFATSVSGDADCNFFFVYVRTSGFSRVVSQVMEVVRGFSQGKAYLCEEEPEHVTNHHYKCLDVYKTRHRFPDGRESQSIQVCTIISNFYSDSARALRRSERKSRDRARVGSRSIKNKK